MTESLLDIYHSDNHIPMTKFDHYMPIYARHLEKFRHRPVRLVELGIGAGGSLQMWKQYLGEHAHIFGADYRCTDGDTLEDRIGLYHLAQENDESNRLLAEHLGQVDVVVDDCSHMPEDQWRSLTYLFPILTEGGVYVCEDVQYSYAPVHGGGVRKPGTFVERVKALVDVMNQGFCEEPLEDSFATHRIRSVQFYANCVVIEKWNANTQVFSPRRTGTLPRVKF